MKHLIFILLITFSHLVISQVVTDPSFPTLNDQVTITFDATEASDGRAAGLLGLTSGVYLWSGVGTDAEPFLYGPDGQTNFGLPFEPGEMTFLGDDKWSITLTPNNYFNIPDEAEITKLGLVFKNADGSAQTEDIIVDIISEGELQIALNNPDLPAFFDDGNEFEINVVSSLSADITLTIDNIEIASQPSTTTLSQQVTATTPGDHDVVITASTSEETEEITFSYIVRQASEIAGKPAGIIPGINYDESDETKVTLCLRAPNKTSVYALGDFNEWTPRSSYQMKKDGEFFWLELSGLTAGTEYAFQYLVDEAIYIPDPFTDKILNSNDQFIPESIYPNLKEYPNQAFNSIGLYNTVSILQTGQTAFNWTNDFTKLAKEDLIIYELLVRDYFGNGEESYQNLIDTLTYIKNLGVNAIELMPVTEFSGNDSWGYNPNFMFAPDKAYGTKNDLKEFIDVAHGMGIAVILDIVLNQQELPSPLLLLDWNFSTNRPSDSNPYFNNDGSGENGATHPFNVFFDMNHESTFTQNFVDTVNHYWLNEYRFDGFRFDLSKGFTQTDYNGDVGAWSGYDAGRIAILKRMADEIWSHSPDAYVILEHFADNTEETELANYGMMLWGNLHGQFEQNMAGNPQDINGLYHGARGWNNPNLIGYMESHDEERQTLMAQNHGQSVSDALERMKLGHAFLLMVPGPKMIWQFGELGYDVSINQNGRTGQKPTPWDNSEGLDYYEDESRTLLRKVISALNGLRNEYDIFHSSNFTFTSSTTLVKQLTFTNEAAAPSSTAQMSAIVVGNFGETSQETFVTFPFEDDWYSYFDQGIQSEFEGATISLELQPGEFRIYTNYQLPATETELLEHLTPIAPTQLELEDGEDGVGLTWVNNSRIYDGIRVYRKSGSSDWELVDEVSSFVETYTDRSVSTGSTYQYRVAAYTAIGESYSNEEEVAANNFVLSSEYNEQIITYPNPTTNVLFIQSEQELDSFIVLDFSGKEVVKGTFDTNDTYRIDLEAAPEGILILELTTRSNEHIIQKIVRR